MKMGGKRKGIGWRRLGEVGTWWGSGRTMWKTKSGGGLKEWEDAGTDGRRLEVNRKCKL